MSLVWCDTSTPIDSVWVCKPAEDSWGSASGHHKQWTSFKFGPGPPGFAPAEAWQRAMPWSSTVPTPRRGPAAHHSHQQVRPGHTLLWCKGSRQQMFSKGIQWIMPVLTHIHTLLYLLVYKLPKKSRNKYNKWEEFKRNVYANGNFNKSKKWKCNKCKKAYVTA